MKKEEKKFYRKKKPWPTKDAMEQVYEMKLWGHGKSKYYSGIGSHHPDLVHTYIEVLKSFLSSFKTPLTVCDLGCGDFNVGKELVCYTEKYVAVDIVPDLIDYNKSIFKAKNLEFQCLDIALDELPSGNCVILRQVLQHLSNAEIQSIVYKLYNYNYIILTEHIPEGDFEPNKDIISGQGIRLKKKSGLNLLAPPFNFKAIEVKKLLSASLKDNEGVVATMLYKT